MDIEKILGSRITQGILVALVAGSIAGAKIHSDKRYELFNQMKHCVDKNSDGLCTKDEWTSAYKSLGKTYDPSTWLTSDLAIKEMRDYISDNQ